MRPNIQKFVAAFMLFPGMWNLVLPGASPSAPLLASPPDRVSVVRAGPQRGEEIRAVLTEASIDESGLGLPLAEERKPRRIIWVLATAYTSSVDETDDTPFITASGTTTHPGTVAANFLYFGTRARIPDYFGDFIFTVEDRMNERYGSGRVDIWMHTKAQARAWGARWVKVELY